MLPKRVSFDDGSYIEYFNREAIMYTEKDGHRMEVVWYFQHVRGRHLNTRDIDHWDSPHETEPLPPEKRNEIERKILEYCRKRRIPLNITMEK